jgi:hypothetical protein
MKTVTCDVLILVKLSAKAPRCIASHCKGLPVARLRPAHNFSSEEQRKALSGHENKRSWASSQAKNLFVRRDAPAQRHRHTSDLLHLLLAILTVLSSDAWR